MKKKELNYLERKSLKEEILALAGNRDWRAILTRYDDPEYHEPLLVWVRPSLGLLQFLAEQVSRLELRGILSVGCGCGFLEWLLVQATGVEVEGLEVQMTLNDQRTIVIL